MPVRGLAVLLAGHTFKKVASIKDTCLACHGGRVGPEHQGKNEGVKGDVAPEELEANQGVIVSEVPPAMPSE